MSGGWEAHGCCEECGGVISSGWEELACPRCALEGALRLLEGGWGGEGAGVVVTDFGDYEIRGEIGRGGMGVVYRAWQKSLSRPVALKMLLGGQIATVESLQRFRLEAEAAARLQHPHVLPVYETGERETFLYYTMRLIDPPRTVIELVVSEAATREEQRVVAEAMAKVARAVAHAHAHGVLHRDLKPGNVLLGGDGEPYVTDFGLAKLTQEADARLTLSAAVLGSPSYLAPEQASGHGRDVTTAADVYGVGAVLYELLTGRAPFRGATALATLREVMETPVRPLRAVRAGIDRDLEVICLKCLEKNPGHRYGGAAEVADELERYLRGEPVVARPVPGVVRVWRWSKRNVLLSVWIGAALMASVAGVAGVLWKWREAEAAHVEADRHAMELAANLYFSTIDQVVLARSQNDFGRARRLLESVKPRAGEEDRRGLEWALLSRLCHGDEEEVHEMKGGVAARAMVWSPSGAELVLAMADGRLEVRDAQSLKVSGEWRVDGGPWDRMLMSPDGEHVLMLGVNGVVVEELKGRRTVFREDGEGRDAAWRDGKRVLVARPEAGGESGGVWQVVLGDSGGVERLNGEVHAPLAVSADGGTAVAARGEDRCRIWDLRTGGTLGEFAVLLRGEDTAAMAFRDWRLVRVAVSADGKYAAGAWVHPGSGARVLVQERGKERPSSMDTFSRAPAVLAFHPGGEALLVAETGAADVRRISFLVSRPRETTLVPPVGRPAYPVYDDHCEQPDAAMLSGELPLALPRRYLTRSACGGRTQFLLGHAGAVHAAAWNPAGDWIASTAADGTLRLWTEPVWHTGRVAAALNMADGVRPVVSADGGYVASRRSAFDSPVQVQIRRTGAFALNAAGYPAGIYGDGTMLSWGGENGFGLYRIGEDARASEEWRLAVPELAGVMDPRDPRACVTTADERLTAGVIGGRVFVMDRGAKKVVVSERLPETVEGAAVDVAFSSDGGLVAVAGYGARGRVFDGATLREVVRLGAADGVDRSVCVLPSGRVVAGGSDGKLREWDVKSGRLVREWMGHDGEVVGLAVHPSGRWLVSSGGGSLRVWDAGSGKLRASIPVANALNWLRFVRGGRALYQSGVWMALEEWKLED